MGTTTTPKFIIDCNKEKAELLYDQLTKLQAYMTGWTDAGKMAPPGSEVLWQIDMMLRNKEDK